MLAEDAFYYQHTAEGIEFMKIRRSELVNDLLLFKTEVLSSSEGQRMVDEKLRESLESLQLVNRDIDHFTTRASNCPDNDDWFYEMILERLRAKQARIRSQVWKWRNRVQMEPGMVAMDGEKERFDIEAIKQVPIDSVIGSSASWDGGNRSTFKCPLHNERTASFVWYKDQNSWHCYGCGKGGSVIDLIMEMENLNFIDACRRLSTFRTI